MGRGASAATAPLLLRSRQQSAGTVNAIAATSSIDRFVPAAV
jgi:hypothetical protein